MCIYVEAGRGSGALSVGLAGAWEPWQLDRWAAAEPVAASRLCHTENASAVAHGRHACCVTQQASLLCRAADIYVCSDAQRTLPPCHTAEMSDASHSRHVWCVTEQTILLFHTADMSIVSHSAWEPWQLDGRGVGIACHSQSAVSHRPHFCFSTRQACLLCHAACFFDASRSRRVCCDTQQTRLL